MNTLEKTDITIGFMPLSDCAPLIVAQEAGFFAQQGLNVNLSKQNSWATLRDKLHVGILDMAQMLAPMPFASQLGLGVAKEEMSVPMVLSYNGNGITLSNAIFAEIMTQCGNDAGHCLQSPVSASGLLPVIAARKSQNQPKLHFATVFPYSCHFYQLISWLETGGIATEDVEISIIPPEDMVSALTLGQIDGFCVGSPWNAAAVRAGVGVTVIASQEIWSFNQEKVLGVLRNWQNQYPATLNAVVRALTEACRWLDAIPNRFEAARWLTRKHYVGANLDVIMPALMDSCLTKQGCEPRQVKGHTLFNLPDTGNKPTVEQGLWLLQQMQRHGHVGEEPQFERLISTIFG